MIGSAMTRGVEKEEEVEVWQIPGQKKKKGKNMFRSRAQFVRRVPVLTRESLASAIAQVLLAYFDPLDRDLSKGAKREVKRYQGWGS